MKRSSILTLAAVALCATFAACSKGSSGNTVKIGLQAPLSGQLAAEGQWAKQCAQIAADLINAKGGVNGKQVEIVTIDDGGNPKDSALAAQKLISQGIKLAVASYGSGITIPAADLYDANKVVSVGYGCTAVRLTMEKKRPYFFRTCGRDDTQSAFFATVVQKLGAKRVAIMHDNTDYGKGVAEDAKRQLQPQVDAKTTEIVYFDAINPGESDYTAVVQKLKTLKPDLWFYTSYYSEAGLLVKQARQAGLNCRFVGSNAVPNPEYVKIAGVEMAKDTLMLNEPMPQFLSSPESTAFLDAYKAKYNEIPGSIWSVYAADAVNAIAAAAKQANSTKPDDVEKALRSLSGVTGITGALEFDENGDRKNIPYNIYRYNEKGELEPYQL